MPSFSVVFVDLNRPVCPCLYVLVWGRSRKDWPRTWAHPITDYLMNRERLQRAARVLIGRVPQRSIQLTNLNKALFYFDLVCLRDHGNTYTGATYVALQHGPVVQNYKSELTEKLTADGRVRLVLEDTWGHPSKRLALVGEPEDLGDADLDAAAARVAERLGTDRATEVSRLSHENLAWLVAHGRGKGTKMDMRLAMHQVMDDDDWMSADLTTEERRDLERRDAGPMVELG